MWLPDVTQGTHRLEQSASQGHVVLKLIFLCALQQTDTAGPYVSNKGCQDRFETFEAGSRGCQARESLESAHGHGKQCPNLWA